VTDACFISELWKLTQVEGGNKPPLEIVCPATLAKPRVRVVKGFLLVDPKAKELKQLEKARSPFSL
jgi:hypothetical protein